jgi:hypothetical protein
MLLPGKCLRCIAQAAAMLIDIACGPLAYKTQILAYHLRRKPIVDFCYGTKKSESDDIDEECSIFNVKTLMLRFCNTKSSMLFKILRVGEAPRVELDKLLDKTTVQGLSELV